VSNIEAVPCRCESRARMIADLADRLREHGWRNLLRHPVVKNTLLLYLAQFSSYVFPLLTLPFLSRVLQPEKFGLVAFAQSFIWYFITLTDYGFALTATRKIAASRDNVDEVSRIFSAVMGAKLVLLGASFVLMQVVVLAVPKLRSEHVLFTVTFLNVVGNVLFPYWFFQGMQRLEQVALRDFLSKLSSTILVFLIIRSSSDYIWAAGIQSAGALIAGVIGLTQVRKVMHLKWTWPAASAMWSELVSGWPVFLSMAAMTLTSSTNIFILGLWATATDVGYYTSAYRVVVMLRMMVSPIVGALYPHMSALGSDGRDRAVHFVRHTGVLLTVPFAVISLTLLATAPWTVKLLFGSRYLPVIPLLQILALSPFLLALSHNYSTYYMLALGYDRQWSRIVLWSAVLNMLILFSLLWTIPPTYAVAITTLAVDIYSVAAAYLFYRRNEAAG